MKIGDFDLSDVLSPVKLKEFNEYLLSLDKEEQYKIILKIIDSSEFGESIEVNNLTSSFNKTDNKELYTKLIQDAIEYGSKLLSNESKIKDDEIKEKLTIYSDAELVNIKSVMNNIVNLKPNIIPYFLPRDKQVTMLSDEFIDEFIEIVGDLKNELIKLKSLNKL